MNPTPTPWRVEAIHAGRASVLAANGYLVALAVGEQEVCDWEHIVRCVNSHDALVEALREIADGCPPDEWTGRDHFGDYEGFDDLVADVDPSNNGDVHAHGWSRGRHSAAIIARAAIALAEGGNDAD